MLKKIKLIVNIIFRILIFKIKIKVKLPKNIELIYFEYYTKKSLNHLGNRFKTFCLSGRFTETKIIYINIAIIFKYLKNLKYGISNSYYISLIQILKPKIVVTVIDNSRLFCFLTKIFFKKIHFIAIQQSNRPQIFGNVYKFNNSFDLINYNTALFYDNFFSIAKCDLHNYKKKNIFINRSKAIGSLNLAIALKVIKEKKIKIVKNKYDICLISDGFTINLNNYYKIKGWEENYALFLKKIIKIIKQNQLKFIFCVKRDPLVFEEENIFYKKYLDKEEIIFLEQNSTERNIKEFISPSYIKMFESKLAISTWSTMLRENLQIGGKSLIVNTDPKKIYKYPFSNKVSNVNFTNKFNLEKKVIDLIKMPKKKYFSSFGSRKNFFIYPYYQKTLTNIENEMERLVNKKIYSKLN